MIFNMTGGMPLNFKVKQYATVDDRPATAAENTIAVITETPISKWVFAAKEPEAEEGMIWLGAGASSAGEFNALRKNVLQVYPQFAMQYVNGAFETKQASIFIGGEWTDLGVMRLFYYGEHRVDITGGWEHTSISANSVTGTFTEADDYLRVSKTGVSSDNCYYKTVNKIDLTDVQTVVFTAKLTASTGTHLTRASYRVFDGSSSVVIVNSDSYDINNYTLDVSALEGEYHLMFGVYFHENRTFTNTVYAIELIYK